MSFLMEGLDKVPSALGQFYLILCPSQIVLMQFYLILCPSQIAL